MQENLIGYIIDKYNNFHHNRNVVRTFNLHGQKYCIRKIDEFEWGQPIFPEKDIEDDYSYFYIYPTLEAAERYIREIKQLAGTRL